MSEEAEVLDFTDIGDIVVPMHYKGRDYEVREATGGAVVKYRNAVQACYQYGPTGKVERIQGIAEVEPLLVSLCVYDDGGKPVPLAEIQKWPARIQKKIFETIKRISDLGETPESERDALEAALLLEDAPISLLDFVTWIGTLKDAKFKVLQDWFKPTSKELAKNGQTSTMAGSGSPA